MNRYSRSQAGVALVEFAIAIPFLMILLIGTIEMGRLAYYNILVGNAARAGAMYGAQNTRTALLVSNMTAAALKDGQNIPQVSVSPAPNYYCQCYNGTTGTSTSLDCGSEVCPAGSHRIIYVSVTVNGRVNTLFNYRALGLPNPWTITRTAIMRVTNKTQ
jgi:Flp pilus assembly protein TadG